MEKFAKKEWISPEITVYTDDLIKSGVVNGTPEGALTTASLFNYQS